MYVYIGFKTSFYIVRHLDSTASHLPTGLHLGFFRSWPSLYLPSSFSPVFLVLSFVSASTSLVAGTHYNCMEMFLHFTYNFFATYLIKHRDFILTFSFASTLPLRRLLPLTKEEDEPNVLQDMPNTSFSFSRLST